MLEELRWRILELLAERHHSGSADLLSTQEIADTVNMDRAFINDECEKLELLGWVKVSRATKGNYHAEIRAAGLVALEQRGEST